MNNSCFFISLMNGAPWGGSEELWYRTALLMAHSGIKTGCAVYDWKEKEEKLSMLEKAGCRVYRMPNLEKTRSNFLPAFFRKLRYKNRLRQFIETLPVTEYKTTVINQGGFEVIHSPWKHFHKKLDRFLLTFHNYDERQNFSTTQKGILNAWLDSAAANLFDAGKIKDVLQKQLGREIPSASVQVNPITFQSPSSIVSYPATDGDYIFSVFAALDIKRKTQDKLVSIFAASKWKERPFRLYLYGEGQDKLYLQDMIDKTGLQDKVILKGHTTDVVSALRETHLVLHITNIDAMPISVVEAMAMSRPLIVSNVGDMPLWVKESENGWVSGSDIDAIEASLEKAWQAKENWAQMGATSFSIFQEKFPEQVEEDFINKYIGESK